MENKELTRNSGIEAMKILAIIMIILSHVVQTLESENQWIPYKDYFIDLSSATTELQNFILSVMRYSGVLGNNIFFACSAYFLLDSRKIKPQKVWNMFLETWVVSILILTVMMLLSNGAVAFKLILKSIFPTIFNNNGYITCYLLFYPLHTTLNQIIDQMEQRALLKVSSILLFLYCGCNFFYMSFFSTNLITWITVYFIIAYMKKYLNNFRSNIKWNILLLLFGIIGNIAVIFVTNLLGLNISFFAHRLLYWCKNHNPFLIMSAITLLNIGCKLNFKNNCINKISKLSLLIYIFHENILIRSYVRPFIWQSIYVKFGYKHIMWWVFIMTIGIFFVSCLLSFLYVNTIQKLLEKIEPKLRGGICRMYKVYEDFITKMH